MTGQRSKSNESSVSSLTLETQFLSQRDDSDSNIWRPQYINEKRHRCQPRDKTNQQQRATNNLDHPEEQNHDLKNP